MTSKAGTASNAVEELLKATLVLSRTVEYVLETHALKSAVPHRLSRSKVQILRLLGRRGGQMPSQVAKFLGVTKSAVTQIIDSMVRERLVTRRTAPADRREVNLELTKKGRDLHVTVLRSQRHYIRHALRQASTREAQRWIHTLHEVSRALAQAEQAFEHFCAQCGAHADGRCVLMDGDADCLFLRQAKRRRSRKKTAGARGSSAEPPAGAPDGGNER